MSDLISKQDVYDALEQYDREHVEPVGYDDYYNGFLHIIESLPSADRQTKVVAQITFDEEKLREIVKGAVERFKEEYEITDRPTGKWEWREVRFPSGGVGMGYKCSKCGKDYFRVEGMKFCPNCGARMTGGEDDA